ncbi:MAG: hypothetical protein GY906_01130, partial [bacterium]|nr:hypothetical protein [bacterium]
IAKWDGASWSPLTGPSGTGASSSVSSLAVFDDGNGEALYVGGSFITAGGLTVNRIAKWDGASWSPLTGPSGTGASSSVSSLAVFDDGNGEALYAGGSFTTAGGVTVNGVGKWDGASWSALTGPAGTGVSTSVSSLAVFDDGNGEALYAGGGFTTAGGVTVNNIAKWDGASWSALTGPTGTGVSNLVLALTVHDDGDGEALYVGGDFTSAGYMWVGNIAKWDGVSWSALSSGLNNRVYALAAFDDGSGEALYAGGSFTEAGASHIAKWVCDKEPPGTVSDLFSPSHPLSTPTANETIDMTWTAATDNVGVVGYGYEFSASSSWTCDQAQDTAGTSATSLPLSDGAWYFHICAADDVGNWGAVISAGRYWVDMTGSIVFLDGFESGDTSAWSSTVP